ncbi:oxygenase MpaB family protein [Nocardiopsis coralliicola]
MGPAPDRRDFSELRRTNAEAVLLGGAAYAVLMQVSHPSVARGVAEHSDFAERPLDRLRATLTFLYALPFGTQEEADRVARGVRAAHARVRGPGYSALDPDLQLWVAATLCEAGERLYRMGLGPLPHPELYRSQCAGLATALGCPARLWPASRAEFAAFWERSVADLAPGDDARAIARDLFAPRNPLLRPLTRIQRLIASGLLPPHVRDGLGLPWGPASQRRFDAAARALRAAYPHLPGAVRRAPAAATLRAFRRRAAR